MAKKPINRDPALQRVIAKCGVRGLARELGIKGPSVGQWTRIPAERVLQIEAITGIDRAKLRPDLYGPKRPRPTRRGDNLAA
jgi:DNA-binding transcriptional regulator YdaS (Cro superfamily)